MAERKVTVLMERNRGVTAAQVRDIEQAVLDAVQPAEPTKRIDEADLLLARLAGDYGCTTIEPADPSLPPTGEPCREKRPDEPESWCYACVASAARELLAPVAVQPAEPSDEEVERAARVLWDDYEQEHDTTGVDREQFAGLARAALAAAKDFSAEQQATNREGG